MSVKRGKVKYAFYREARAGRNDTGQATTGITGLEPWYQGEHFTRYPT